MLDTLKTGAKIDVRIAGDADSTYTPLEQQSDINSIDAMGLPKASSGSSGDTIINYNIAGNLIDMSELIKQLDSQKDNMLKQGRSI